MDAFHPTTGEVRSDGADGIACWFIDTDYNEESFFVRHAYFLGANDSYKALKTTLKADHQPLGRRGEGVPVRAANGIDYLCDMTMRGDSVVAEVRAINLHSGAGNVAGAARERMEST